MEQRRRNDQGDVGKPSLPTAEALAKALAGKDGKVAPTTVAIDGEKGYRVHLPSTNMEKPREVVIVFRKRLMHMIAAAGKDAAIDVAGPFDTFLKSWKWSE